MIILAEGEFLKKDAFLTRSLTITHDLAVIIRMVQAVEYVNKATNTCCFHGAPKFTVWRSYHLARGQHPGQ